MLTILCHKLDRLRSVGPESGYPWFLASTKILNQALRTIYPLKNPAKSVQKTSTGKRIIFIGGALMAILYFRKHPEKANNLKDEFLLLPITQFRRLSSEPTS